MYYWLYGTVRTIVLSSVPVIIQLWRQKLQLIRRMGQVVPLPKEIEAKVPLTETDLHYIDRTRKILQETFGSDIASCLWAMTSREREKAVIQLAERLAAAYGLEISVNAAITDPQNFGSYDWNNRTISFRTDGITSSAYPEDWPYRVHTTLKTLIHELRHAIQHRAILEDDFWQVPLATRGQWALSRLHYTDDPENYLHQSIELDAMVFAEKAMEGVIPLWIG